MTPGDGWLEVVDHLRSARWPWPGNVLRCAYHAAVEVTIGVVPVVRIGGRHAEAGYQQHDPVTRQIGERIDFFTASQTESGAPGEEERHVGAKRGGHIGQL